MQSRVEPTPAILRRVAFVVIAWAISEPLLLDFDGGAARWRALAFGLLVSVPLLAARRAPVLVAGVVVLAYLAQQVTGDRTFDAMSPELALAFGLFSISAYAPGASARRFFAIPAALAAPLGLWVASALDLGVVRDVATSQYLYLGAVVTAGVLPGLALRSRHEEVAGLEAEVEALYVEAATHIGAAVDGERRQLGHDLTQVVTGLVGEIERLAAEARTTLASAGGETAALGRSMAAAAGRAGDELRALLRTLTADPVAGDADAAATGRRVDLRAWLGLAAPSLGLAILAVADRSQTPDLPVTLATADGQTLVIDAPTLPLVLGYALAILTPAALLWRRRFPVLAIEATGGLLVLQVALGELSSLNITQVFTCGVLAYLAGAWPRTLPSALLAGALALGTTAGCWLLEQYRFDPVVYAYMVAVLVGAWLIGRTVRDDLREALGLRERAHILRAQRARLCELAVSGERRDIAREMHDVVGHGLSLITVQAGVVDVLAQRDRMRALDALRVVEGAARSTQAELGALQLALAEPVAHANGSTGAEAGLRRWSVELDRIVVDARAVGQPVLAWIDPQVDGLEPSIGSAVLRIAQEAFTNVRKHAGGAATTLEVSMRGARLHLVVANATGERLADAPAGSGLGIAGMADRVAELGGTVEAGPSGAGGWTVTVRIPLPVSAA